MEERALVEPSKKISKCQARAQNGTARNLVGPVSSPDRISQAQCEAWQPIRHHMNRFPRDRHTPHRKFDLRKKPGRAAVLDAAGSPGLSFPSLLSGQSKRRNCYPALVGWCKGNGCGLTDYLALALDLCSTSKTPFGR